MKLLSIIFILVFAFSVLSQDVPPPLVKGEMQAGRDKSVKAQTKRRQKEEKQLRKEQEKRGKQLKHNAAMQNVVDLDEVGRFPQNYTNRTLRFKGARLGELRRYTEDGQSIYFVEVTSPKGIIFGNYPNTMPGLAFGKVDYHKLFFSEHFRELIYLSVFQFEI